MKGLESYLALTLNFAQQSIQKTTRENKVVPSVPSLPYRYILEAFNAFNQQRIAIATNLLSLYSSLMLRALYAPGRTGQG